jgi:hypothetical protein
MIPTVSGGALPLPRTPVPLILHGRVLTARATAAFAFLVVCLALLFWLAIAARAEPKFPALTGRIVDEAGLLSPDDRRQIEAELEALEAKSTDQIVVYTTRSLQGYPIEDFGYQLGRAWQIGQKGKDNGVVLIVAPNDRKVRIEVGRGLEPQLTDLMSKLIIENARRGPRGRWLRRCDRASGRPPLPTLPSRTPPRRRPHQPSHHAARRLRLASSGPTLMVDT